MVGFGLMDNSILIHAGDAIERRFGVQFNLKGLAAAACGQVISDFCGVCFGGCIEALSRRHIAAPGLTLSQAQLRVTQLVGTAGAATGVVVGCLLGMCNLLVVDLEAAERLKRATELETIFKAVMESATATMACPVGTLFVVDGERREIWTRSTAGYEGVVRRPLEAAASLAAWVAVHGLPAVVNDAHADPRFCADIERMIGVEVQSVMTYPVFAPSDPGRVVAVVQFFNKPGGFCEEDGRVLQMLCTHCGIFMSTVE